VLADLAGELEERRRPELTERVRRFVQPTGSERALDVGAGTGALAFALAPHVAEVLGIEPDEELLAEGRRRNPFRNVTLVAGDGTRLDLQTGSFDLAGCLRTLHHVRRPELVLSELARVVRLGGAVLVVDQLAPADPLAALELDRFERARDPTHARLLPDVDVRALLEANGLVLRRSEEVFEDRELGWYLDLAGCHGDERERAAALAPGRLRVTIGWYLAVKPAPRA